MTTQAQISTFHPRYDPTKHVKLCQKEWKQLGYHNEHMWPHLFPSTFDDLPNKWYKIEEGRGDTFTWKIVKQNFIKYFLFFIDDENIQPIARQIQ